MTQHHVVPPAVRAATRAPVPSTDVEAWRLRRLVDAGFPLQLALELAATPGVDLHALFALLDRGCPPELAARILAPIDGTDGRP
jgi:hypothetical protein